MPQVGRPFSPIEVGETNILSIGFGSPVWSMVNQSRVRLVFASQLAPGETIISVAWGCAAVDGVDPDAADCLGVETNTAAVASVSCTGFLANVTYAIEAAATTSLGQILKASTTIFCEPSPVSIIPISGLLSFDFTQPSNLVL